MQINRLGDLIQKLMEIKAQHGAELNVIVTACYGEQQPILEIKVNDKDHSVELVTDICTG